MDDSFGTFVRLNRKRLGLSQSDFGKMVGLSRVWISNIERDEDPATGEPPRVGADKLKRMASAFGVPISDLLNRSAHIPDGFQVVPETEVDYQDSDPIDYLPESEARLVEAYRQASGRQKQLLDLIVQEVQADGSLAPERSLVESIRDAEAEGARGKRVE